VIVAAESALDKRFDGEPALAWRARQLHRAGFTEQQAGWLAECKSVDLHYALELLKQGLAAGSSREVIFDVLAE
jgi:hypothetical protein